MRRVEAVNKENQAAFNYLKRKKNIVEVKP